MGVWVTEYPVASENWIVIGAATLSPDVMIWIGVSGSGELFETPKMVKLGAFTCNFAELPVDAPLSEHVSVYVSVPDELGVTVWVPVTGWDPLHAPLPMQEVALVEDQARVAV